MKRKKDLSKISAGCTSNISAGYKRDPYFQTDQLSKVLNLDSYYSYISVNLYDTDEKELLDEVLPYTIRELSKIYPFVVIRSAALTHIEIVFMTVNSIFDISTQLYSIRSSIKYHFPHANLK